MTEARRVEISVCPKHGLRYNAAEELGCVRCRREDGAGVGRARVVGGAGAGRAQAAPRRGDAAASAPTQLLLAALLVSGTGVMFWAAHQEVLESFGSVFGLSAEGPGAATDPMAMEDDLGLGETGEGVEPAGYPPDGTVAVGPAAQEQQMRELMRQMEEDARIDAEDAAAEAAREAEREPAYDAGDGGFEPEE